MRRIADEAGLVRRGEPLGPRTTGLGARPVVGKVDAQPAFEFGGEFECAESGDSLERVVMSTAIAPCVPTTRLA